MFASIHSIKPVLSDYLSPSEAEMRQFRQPSHFALEHIERVRFRATQDTRHFLYGQNVRCGLHGPSIPHAVKEGDRDQRRQQI
ncbi:MAG TPA: hypothetical protein VE621_22425 [Bryobacteraceae bacterium]|nr:hypothetical protein [Bryobacteraceae bacterium]